MCAFHITNLVTGSIVSSAVLEKHLRSSSASIMTEQDNMESLDTAVDPNFDYMYKILIVGNSGVGKTAFLVRYCDETFSPSFVATVGIDFKVKTLFRCGGYD